MKRAAVLLSLFLAVPEVIMAAGTTRMIVVTRRPATEALARMRGDDFDPAARADRYKLKTFKIINGFAADLDESEIATLQKSPEVEYLEPAVERHAFSLATSGISKMRAANDSISAEIGRDTRMPRLPSDIMSDWRSARSIAPPSTSPRMSGALG